MAKSTVSDILQAVGFSELIETFEGVSTEEFAALQHDTKRIKEIVPEAQVNDFTRKIKTFFNEVHFNEMNLSVDVSEEDSEEEFNETQNENVDRNNVNSIFSIESVNIKKILESTFEGRKILSWYTSKSFLNPGQRKRLVHFVVAGVLNICERDLTPKDFTILSHKIVEVFPKECHLVYYEPRIKKSDSDTGRGREAKGKLLHKYRNLKRNQEGLKALREIEHGIEGEITIEASVDVQASIEWLCNQEEPWTEAERHWNITRNYRCTQIKTVLTNKISSIYEAWPILKCPKAYLLIIQDFSSNNFCENENSIQNFNDFYLKASQVRLLKKDDHCDLLKSLLENEGLKEDDGTLMRLMLLCCMLPSFARIPIGNRKKWKPSAVESLEGIVTRIKIHGDIEKVKSDRHLYAKSKNLTVQPYIIVVEEDDYAVNSIYLCIDDILYEIPTLLEALDVCFKSFHVYNARYTVQSEHIWLLLQLGLYKFRTKWDSSITSVTELLNDMGCNLPS